MKQQLTKEDAIKQWDAFTKEEIEKIKKDKEKLIKSKKIVKK